MRFSVSAQMRPGVCQRRALRSKALRTRNGVAWCVTVWSGGGACPTGRPPNGRYLDGDARTGPGSTGFSAGVAISIAAGKSEDLVTMRRSPDWSTEKILRNGRDRAIDTRKRNAGERRSVQHGKKRKREVERRQGADREKFGAEAVVMPRRFSTYPRVRTEAAMHVHRKSVGRAPFSTTVLVVGNGRSAGTGGYVENLPACAEFGRGKMGAGDHQRENAVREGRRCGSRRSRLGGCRADAAQCAHCALDGWSARGDGRARARVAPRAVPARKTRGR